jgi:16S rRNA (adenine1518-N6/adenine1519-N6)-dimethyltransferase
MKAKKSLGQHFLVSKKALSQIIDAGDIHTDDLVLEIGPGKGVLTERLLAKEATVVVIEKDRDLIPLLQETFPNQVSSNKLNIIHDDVLKFDPTDLTILPTSYKLIANIPYYITGAIIEQFLSTTHQPTCMVLLMQREVAERIVARDHKHSILSIAVQVYGTPKIIGRVPPGAFVPPPTVESAILLIEGISRNFFIGNTPEGPCSEVIFFSVLKAVFGKKRKQIGGSLADHIGDRDLALQILSQASIDPKTRPETMTMLDWKKITQVLEQSQSLI